MTLSDPTEPPAAPALASPAFGRRRALALAAGAATVLLGGSRPAAAARFDISRRANHLVLQKSARKLTLMNGRAALASYRVGLGFKPAGRKTASGDGRTPEGEYFIDRRNARSEFYLSLGISYPNAADLARSRQLGVDPGGDIFIHGDAMRPGGRLGAGPDWTAGCIAVTNPEIEEMWATVPNGTPITILA